VSVLAILIGIVLLLPLICATLWRPSAFGPLAFKPIFRASLQKLANRSQLTQEIILPSDQQLGAVDLERRYIVLATAGNHYAHCWKEIGISASVKIADRMVPVKEASGPPYGWSSKCSVSGVSFSARGGEHLDLTIWVSADSELPDGEVMLLPFWSEAKDRLVESMISDSAAKLGRFTTPAALILIIGGGILFHRKA
jgi:hypothetical protein